MRMRNFNSYISNPNTIIKSFARWNLELWIGDKIDTAGPVGNYSLAKKTLTYDIPL